MSRTGHRDIRIGTLAPLDRGANYLKQILPHGFESFELTAWATTHGLDLKEAAKPILDCLGDKAIISSIGMYGNPMTDETTRKEFGDFIRHAHDFGCNVVCGFAGAIETKSVGDQIDDFVAVWKPLAQLAADQGVRIAFENCDMGGTWSAPKWNIAHSPRAWDMMFDAIGMDCIGLEWEPCHQMVSFVDPIANLRQYAGRVYHVHGKDATVNNDLIRRYGLRSDQTAVFHRTPGFGDTNWADIITILRLNNFVGAIDIEGWHDPVYKEELEMTGQVHALNYLKAARGGCYVPNPD
jgi:sugar phosphate isomerase/epimerase